MAHNVNIKCSTGFYNLVVLPTFSGITEQYVINVDNITIRCTSITGQVDNSNANVTAAINFSLSNPDNSSAGNVHLHLHHTTRRIQLQGSSLVHGETRAPVWYMDKVLLGLFNKLARDKSVDILEFNNGVHEAISKCKNKQSSQARCSACNAFFIGRSLQETCSLCKLKFHRKCIQGNLHTCRSNPVKRSVAYSSMSSIHQHQPIPSTSQPVQAVANSEVHTVPAPSSSYLPSSTPPQALSPPQTATRTQTVSNPPLHTSPATSPAGSSTQTIPTSSASSSPSRPLSQPLTTTRSPGNPLLNPLAPSFSSQQLPTHFPVSLASTSVSFSNAFASTITTTQNRRQKKKTTPTIAQAHQNLDLECARIELNTAQTKIKAHENTIADLKFRNKILEDRVAQLDTAQKKSIYEKYFPTNQESPAGSQVPPNHHCCYQHQPAHPQYHCHHPQACAFQPHHARAEPQQQQRDDSIAQIKESIVAIQNDINALKQHSLLALSPSSNTPHTSGHTSDNIVDDDQTVVVSGNEDDAAEQQDLMEFSISSLELGIDNETDLN